MDLMETTTREKTIALWERLTGGNGEGHGRNVLATLAAEAVADDVTSMTAWGLDDLDDACVQLLYAKLRTLVDHHRDADCINAGTVDRETGDCHGCGVGAGPQCRGCGGTRYHSTDDCPESDDGLADRRMAFLAGVEPDEPCSPGRKLDGDVTRIAIVLEVEGDPDDAMTVIDAMLDNGDPQDTINEHDNDDAGPLNVTSAVAVVQPRDLEERLTALDDVCQLLWPSDPGDEIDNIDEMKARLGAILAFLKPAT
jgi:hypothetical protein